MLYIIALVAIALFVYGVQMKKNQASGKDTKMTEVTREESTFSPGIDPLDHEKLMEEVFDREEFLLLRARVEDVEGTLFRNLLAWQEEKAKLLEKMEAMENSHGIQMTKMEDAMINIEFYPVDEHKVKKNMSESTLAKKVMPPHIRAVVEYEKEGKSLSEIATLTKMNKGEVLLLKNLSKHYEA